MKQVGILGVGMMGVGIVYFSVMSGILVVLKDILEEVVVKGKVYSEKLLVKWVFCGQMSQEKVDVVLVLIKFIVNVEDLQGCDLVIEVVFEKQELKVAVI